MVNNKKQIDFLSASFIRGIKENSDGSFAVKFNKEDIKGNPYMGPMLSLVSEQVIEEDEETIVYRIST